MKKLTKSNERMICVVCAGFAKYFGIDPTIVRLIWAVLVLCAGTGLLAYIICAIIMPNEETTLY